MAPTHENSPSSFLNHSGRAKRKKKAKPFFTTYGGRWPHGNHWFWTVPLYPAKRKNRSTKKEIRNLVNRIHERKNNGQKFVFDQQIYF